MPISSMTSVIEHLRRVVLLRDGAGLGDGELLGCFIERRDEAALAALVKRHGPMVWGVCRRLLSHHDAEDAFQATFLVLVRKSASIVPREMVGNWLYGAAHQTALQARRTAARRRAREVQVTQMPDTEAVQQDQWPDVQPLLDQELSRLPDNYRVVIVLCDLEGRTRKEVARQLGVPEGTVAGRLARARAMLAKRLAQRGVTLSGGALEAVLAQNMVSAGVPGSVVSSTISAANLFAAGQTAAVPVKVAALTEGVLKTMLLSKLKNAAALLVVIALIGLGAIGVAKQGPLAVARSPTDPHKEDKEPAAAQDENPAPNGPVAKKTEQPTPDVRILKGHSSMLVQFAVFSSNGKTLATGAKDVNFKNPAAPRATDEVILWDVTTQQAKHKIQLKDPVHLWCLTLSPDGKTLAVGTNVGVELHDAETGKVKHMLKGSWAKSTGPFVLAFSPNSKTLAAGGSARDHNVRLWDVQTGELTGTLKGHDDAVVGLNFSPDGKTLASTGGMYDTTIRYWEVATGQLRLTVKKAKEESKDGTEAVDGDWQTWPAAFSPDGKILARGRGDEVKFWDARTGKVKGRVIESSHPHNRLIQSLAFSPDGKLVAAGRDSGEIDVWETRPADRKYDWRIADLKQSLKEHSAAQPQPKE
jgi:RNA polymerase sigma factor (sigma-70 family)